jgi:hypothetical protein
VPGLLKHGVRAGVHIEKAPRGGRHPTRSINPDDQNVWPEGRGTFMVW